MISITLAVYVYNKPSSIVSEEKLKQSYFREIQGNLDFHSSQLATECLRAVDYFEKGNITEFKSDYTVFHLSNGRLNYWTDYHIPFKPRFASGVSDWKVIKTAQGVFLVHTIASVSENGVNQIIGVIELFRDYNLSSSYLKSGYNSDIFNDYAVVRKTITDKGGVLLKVSDANLWRIDLEINSERLNWVVVAWLFLLFVGFSAFLLLTIVGIRYFLRNKKPVSAFLLLFLFLFIVRLAMLWSHFPRYYFDFSFFDSGVFGSTIASIPEDSWLTMFNGGRSFTISVNPSFGDLCLNLICLFILGLFAYKYIFSEVFFKWLTRRDKTQTNLLSFSSLLISFITLLFISSLFHSIYANSVVNFDITTSLHLDEPELIYVIIFVALVAFFLLVNHLVLRILSVIHDDNIGRLIWHLVITSLPVFLLAFYLERYYGLIVLINCTYLFVAFATSLFVGIIKLQYKSYIYLTIASLVCSFVVSLILSYETKQKEMIEREGVADQLLLHNDLSIGYLMVQVGNQISSDRNIASNLKNGFLPKEGIESRIRKKYLSTDFEEYDINFFYFNKKGNGYYHNSIKGNLGHWKEAIQLPEYLTKEEGVYYVTDPKKEFYGTYYQFIKVKDTEGLFTGSVIVSYELKKYIAKSILPGLLQLSSKAGHRNLENVNYAIFDRQKLLYSVGDFNFNSDYFKPYLTDQKNYSNDFLKDKYFHYIKKGIDQRLVVVSSKDTSWIRLMTNFSFHFLIIITAGLIFLVLRSIIQSKNKTTSDFSTKIQTYLNLATFVPMLILSVFILGLISTSYKNDQEAKYESSSKVLSAQVYDYLNSYYEGEIDLKQLKQATGKLSKYSGADINLYDSRGVLMLSSQPLLYEAGVVSNLINPEARFSLLGMKRRSMLLEEQIGDFKYSTVYVGLFDPENAKFLGIIGVPFFNSSYQIEKKKISALTIILNVFAIAFVLLLIASFFVTKGLTSPLKLIANKLRKVETGHENEPLYWGANDELGLLIDGYNQMLVKIEESKKTIVRTEKEQAWKDMAQQVAHEIKNPLTPMRLKLQHLKRVISTEDERTATAIDSLLEQVDTMNEIATSFSSFAKMPAPEMENIDLSEVVEHTALLYQNDENYDVIIDVDPNVWAHGDDQLLGRIITNLILNGVQSVSSEVRPLISVTLRSDQDNEGKALLSIKDNGTGIPNEIQDKVFIPNFTTKYTGSGIGLAVAKNGIGQMGGEIWFHTNETDGTTFFISLNKIV